MLCLRGTHLSFSRHVCSSLLALPFMQFCQRRRMWISYVMSTLGHLWVIWQLSMYVHKYRENQRLRKHVHLRGMSSYFCYSPTKTFWEFVSWQCHNHFSKESKRAKLAMLFGYEGWPAVCFLSITVNLASNGYVRVHICGLKFCICSQIAQI